MASYNKVILMGNLTRDPELKYLPSGTAVTRLRLAVNHTYTDRQSGERKEEVCFIDMDALGRTAETMNEYLLKGRTVLIEGRLRFQTWETDDGQKRSKHDVFVERFSFVDSRQGGQDALKDEGAGYASPTDASRTDTEDDIPF